MDISKLKNLYLTEPRIAEIISNLSGSKSSLNLSGLLGSAATFVVASVFRKSAANHIIICDDKERAAYFYNDLQVLVGEEAVLFFPSSARKPYQVEEVDNANVLARAETLNRISSPPSKGGAGGVLIVSYAEALSEKVITQKVLKGNTLIVHKGESLSQDFVIEMMHEYGFEHTDYVAIPGEFAIRGGIIDVYSFASELPFRIEFFGDEVESLRAFDPSTQLSIHELDKVNIMPNVQGSLLKEERATFFDFVASGNSQLVLWFEDFENAAVGVEKNFEKAKVAHAELGITLIDQLEPAERFVSQEEFLRKAINYPRIELKSSNSNSNSIDFHTNVQPTFNKNFDLLALNLAENFTAGILNIICCDSAKQTERLKAIFHDISPKIIKQLHAEAKMIPPNGDLSETFITLETTLHEGFIDKDLKTAIYTDHQIFERYHRFKLKERVTKSKQALTMKELSGLQPGDYVTHIDHGIGKFAGLEKMEVNGKMQEAIRLVYRDNDILYVSIHSLHRIAKYTANSDEPPKIHKLGSGVWATQKAKTKAKVKDIAKDLIALYAKRRAQKGFEFSPDNYMQAELEASFIYEDTPDQLKSTQDIKRDMEQPFPMDRLICGDVGFGKTEVAIRAAFKAVCDGKQVAILVPTTILATQHYKTFAERLKNFPVKVDYLNRFRTSSEQKKTIEQTEKGLVDILIGTHRLVSKDVKFKDLGLMVIDEEQKFGVSTKEKLKQMKVNVDTLTLTATPIPRTLQFSLMGARDLSVIATPPPNRYPVETTVTTFSEEMIRDAVAYEISRGGQVFFIHNRIGNLMEVAGIIQRLVPDARVAFGHGQMEGDKLEEIMLGFIEGEFDVLVSTTIVESGLDIPNANTIIINDAHKFGLSDLHQMRGRVGRSNKKAFCYLLTLPASLLSGDARRRMKALEDFSDLGSGFNIAMRDLDIRGAGNILGGEQSGFISDIGFEMYQKILDEALQELASPSPSEGGERNAASSKGGENPNGVLLSPSWGELEGGRWKVDSAIDTDMEILIPDAYVNSIAERISLYKKLDDSRNETELQTFEKNITDRFGTPPPPVMELFNTIRLRWLAQRLGMEKVVLKSNRMVCYFISNQNSPFYQSDAFTGVLKFVQQNPHFGKMKESTDRLTMTFENVRSVKNAMETLDFVLGGSLG